VPSRECQARAATAVCSAGQRMVYRRAEHLGSGGSTRSITPMSAGRSGTHWWPNHLPPLEGTRHHMAADPSASSPGRSARQQHGERALRAGIGTMRFCSCVTGGRMSVHAQGMESRARHGQPTGIVTKARDTVAQTSQDRRVECPPVLRYAMHGEKSPSFVVTPARQTWHFFGCGLGGGSVAAGWATGPWSCPGRSP